jgi:acetoacetyl-CoA synthetase
METSRIGRWMTGLGLGSYEEAWQWSVRDLEGFWSSLWAHFSVAAHDPPRAVLAERAMPGAVWFPGATLNYAEHAVGRAPPGEAILSLSHTRPRASLTGAELAAAVARARGGLRRLGVGPGDRVVAYLPNIAETAVAFLATASLGAVWSSCPPEFGPRGVIDRFGQIDPVVLFTVDGYRHRGTEIDRTREVAAIRDALPRLEATIELPYLGVGVRGATATWDEIVGGAPEPGFEPVGFSHPLYVLYSSGTTGLPKPIVHGHGGILVEHLKVQALHHDIGPGDRFFWYTTTGWMMWNYLVSGLLNGASIVCVDGDAAYPDAGWLWRMAADEGVTHFGTSAGFIMACRKQGLAPGHGAALREVGSTGSPLPADGFRWVRDAVGPGVRVASVSGGTDVCTAFVGGAPVLPVTAGEISGRCLGAAVEAYDEEGHPLVGRQGTLVVTEPMPSMPVGLWGDEDGSRYRAAYFDRFPGVWDHGDWITITERGTCIITGRSDATLNRGGVRIGTSELYAVVEEDPAVADSLVVHLEDASGGPGTLVLFVQPVPGATVDEARLASALRTSLSPRHVPDRIIEVRAIPRTLSGKKLEVPVKRILSGVPAARAASRDALADPGALDEFEQLAAAWQ